MEEFQKILIERFQVLGSASLIFLLFLLVARNNGYFKVSRPSKKNLEVLSTKVFFWSFGVFLVLQLLVTPLTFQFWYYFYTLGEEHMARFLTPEVQGWVSIYGIFVSGLGMFLYFLSLSVRDRQIILGSYALKGWKEKLQDFFIAFMSWLLSYPLVIAVGQIVAIILMFTYENVEPQQVAVNQIKNASTSTSLLVVLILCVIFIVPMIEELLFRGFLQNWLKKFVSSGKAIIFTSFIFALFHFASAQGMGNIELIISLFVLSCFLGYIYERQKSLWAPISMHAIFNAISILLIFYADKESI